MTKYGDIHGDYDQTWRYPWSVVTISLYIFRRWSAGQSSEDEENTSNKRSRVCSDDQDSLEGLSGIIFPIFVFINILGINPYIIEYKQYIIIYIYTYDHVNVFHYNELIHHI